MSSGHASAKVGDVGPSQRSLIIITLMNRIPSQGEEQKWHLSSLPFIARFASNSGATTVQD